VNPTTALMLSRTIENDRRRELERRHWRFLRAERMDTETRGPRSWSLRLPRLPRLLRLRASTSKP
jgi:hypothetical protein